MKLFKTTVIAAALLATGAAFAGPGGMGMHQPGERIVIQSLPLTLGLLNTTWVVLDALRRKRNVNDYQGDPIESEALSECIAQATPLLGTTSSWLAENHPDYL